MCSLLINWFRTLKKKSSHWMNFKSVQMQITDLLIILETFQETAAYFYFFLKTSDAHQIEKWDDSHMFNFVQCIQFFFLIIIIKKRNLHSNFTIIFHFNPPFYCPDDPVLHFPIHFDLQLKRPVLKPSSTQSNITSPTSCTITTRTNEFEFEFTMSSILESAVIKCSWTLAERQSEFCVEQ